MVTVAQIAASSRPDEAARGLIAPAAIDDPIAMLRETHRRTEMRCGLLERLEEHLAEHGCDARARACAAALLDHFEAVARVHEADEEEDLLPALRQAVSRRQKKRVTQLIAEIGAVHAQLDAAWQHVRLELREVERGVRARLDPQVIGGFTTLVLAHIAREEAEVLPEAVDALGRDALRRIGAAMALRRASADKR